MIVVKHGHLALLALTSQPTTQPTSKS